MKKQFLVLALCACAVGAFAASDPMTDWHVRPREIITGELQVGCPALWEYAPGAEKNLSVDNGATLSGATERPLWHEMTLKVSNAPKDKVTVITFPKPFEVKDAAGLELWVYGPTGAWSRVSYRCTDANGDNFEIQSRSGSSNWAHSPWWGRAIAKFPNKTAFPVKVNAVAFKIASRATDTTFYVDRLGAFQYEKDLTIPDTSKRELPFPTSPEGNRPLGGPDGGKWGVTKSGDAYVFRYEGADGKLEYRYTPKTGTLSDVTASVNGGEPFQIAKNGGVGVKMKGAKFNAADAANNNAKLESSKLANNELTTKWSWSRGKRKFEFTMKMSIYKRVFEVTIDAADPVVERFDVGFVDGSAVNTPHLFQQTYLNNRWDAPRLLATQDFLMSVFVDWYVSNASGLVETGASSGLDGAKVIGEHSARIMGGTLYGTKNDGTRNPLHERIYYTISPELADVLPTIRNPKSPYFDEMAKLVCVQQSYVLQGKGDMAATAAFWERFAAYGANDIFLRFHGGKFRMPMASNRLNRLLDSNLDVGTNEEMRAMVTSLKKSVKRVGPYEDNRIMSPLGPDFRYAYMAQWSDDNFKQGWDNGIICNPSSISVLQKEFSPKFVEKYGWNACYFDEVTNTPPWGLTNYDPRDPGAAMFRSTFRDYALSAMEMRDYYHGPIWSEGNAMYFWAGMLDTDYAQTNEPESLPMPEFKLTKINPLECTTGYDLTRTTAPVDFLIANQIVYGNIGFLWDGEGHISFGQIKGISNDNLRAALKSYFMMRQLQEQYAGVPVKSVRYFIDDKFVTASEMLRQNLQNSGKVRVDYTNGLAIWVNRNAEENWEVKVNGEMIDLPPTGYAAFKADTILEYSAEIDGQRVDYSRGLLYTYVDGRGNRTTFPEIQASHAYVMFTQPDGSKKLIPAPFVAAEQLGNLAATSAQPCNMQGAPDGKALTVEVIDCGKGRFETIPSAFSYVLK